MAYDEDLANRIRELMADEDAVSEKRMFGGLAFLVLTSLTDRERFWGASERRSTGC